MRTFAFHVLALLAAGAVAVALPAQEPQLTDRQIGDAIEDELRADHAVVAHRIDVQPRDGIVTLTGTTDNLMAADRAAAIARTVKGVRAVVNRMRVIQPHGLEPVDVQTLVTQALLTDPATDSYEVEVIGEPGGEIALRGQVQSWAERDLCERVAKAVAGVTAVQNDITVAPAASRPDHEIRNEVEQRLRWHLLVDDGLIDVACEDGTVTLTGTVGSATEVVQARRCARVAGVTNVESDGLQVAGWARDPRLRDSKHAVRSDQQITEAVQAALLHDPRVASFQVRPAVHRGVVTLRGNVDNLKAARAAEQDARNTVGVIRVVNRLRVQPGADRSITAIADDVRRALLRDPYVDRFAVDVDVRPGGIVHLRGIVDSNFERACADDVASRINGVTDVRNHLRVSHAGMLPFDPYIDPWPVHGYAWFRYQPPVTFTRDAEIEADIEDELWWSPFVDSDAVQVEVSNGTAVLTGTVGSRAEWQSATENAYEGGAIWVVNDLEVAGESTSGPEAEASAAGTDPDGEPGDG